MLINISIFSDSHLLEGSRSIITTSSASIPTFVRNIITSISTLRRDGGNDSYFYSQVGTLCKLHEFASLCLSDLAKGPDESVLLKDLDTIPELVSISSNNRILYLSSYFNTLKRCGTTNDLYLYLISQFNDFSRISRVDSVELNTTFNTLFQANQDSRPFGPRAYLSACDSKFIAFDKAFKLNELSMFISVMFYKSGTISFDMEPFTRTIGISSSTTLLMLDHSNETLKKSI